MSFLNSWPRLLARSTGRALKERQPSRQPRSRKLRFESLEDRVVLSASFGSALGIGSATNDVAFDVATDPAGNSYLTGYFSGTVDFDPAAIHPGDTDILTTRGGTDAFVAKYAPDNSLVWVQRMGGDSASLDAGRKIEIDPSGNVYVAGNFGGSSDFGSTTLSTAGDTDGFVTKLDASGTFQWAKSWGTAGTDQGQGVGVDSAGNVYALGIRVGAKIDYDVLKFSPTGAAVWSKSINAQAMMFSAELAVNASGNAFVAGSFTGTVDFDPSSKTHYVSSGPNQAGFVLNLDTTGKFKWVSPFVGRTVGSTSGYAAATSVALDGSGNVVVGGSYINSVDFNPGSGTTTLPTIGGGFITKLNSSGGLVWARALVKADSSSNVGVYGLAVDTAGNVYATGGFSGTVDFDPGAGIQTQTSAGGSDVFAMKLDASGNLAWAETVGGTGTDTGYGIAVDPTGTVHLAGRYAETVDFDPDPFSTYDLTSAGVGDIFLLKLLQS